MRSVLLLVLILLAGYKSASAETIRFGLSDPKLVRQFEEELNTILFAPPDVSDRSGSDEDGEPRNPQIKQFLKSDPGLEAAWRANPEETLKLISRIRDAVELAN